MERHILQEKEFVLTEDIDVGRLHIEAGTHGTILERHKGDPGYWVSIARIPRLFVHDYEVQML